MEIIKESNKRKFAESAFLSGLSKELPAPFYYDLHYLAKTAGTKIPQSNVLIKLLKKKGFSASRTHFCATAVKTNASFAQLKKILK